MAIVITDLRPSALRGSYLELDPGSRALRPRMDEIHPCAWTRTGRMWQAGVMSRATFRGPVVDAAGRRRPAFRVVTNDDYAESTNALVDYLTALDPYAELWGGVPLDLWRKLNYSHLSDVYLPWRERRSAVGHGARYPVAPPAVDDVVCCQSTAALTTMHTCSASVAPPFTRSSGTCCASSRSDAIGEAVASDPAGNWTLRW